MRSLRVDVGVGLDVWRYLGATVSAPVPRGRIAGVFDDATRIDLEIAGLPGAEQFDESADAGHGVHLQALFVEAGFQSRPSHSDDEVDRTMKGIAVQFSSAGLLSSRLSKMRA